MNRKCILEMMFEYIYNNGVTVNFESHIESYLENLLDFLINLNYKVAIEKHYFTTLLYFLVIHIFHVFITLG